MIAQAMNRVSKIKRGGILGREGGQSLAELAIIMPMLTLVLVGLLDMGRVIYTYTVMVNAAREAALVGSVSERTNTQIQNVAIAEMDRGGVDGDQATISVSYYLNLDTEKWIIQVEVQYTESVLGAVLPFSSVPLKAKAEMETFWEPTTY